MEAQEKIAPNIETNTSGRRNMVQSVDDLTAAIKAHTLVVNNFMTQQKWAIPYPLVIIMFAIMIGILFGIGALQKLGMLPIFNNVQG